MTGDAFNNKGPLINNRGDIVWAKADPAGYELWLRTGGVSRKIGSYVNNRLPLPFVLNDQGQVAWINTTGRVYLYSGGTNTEISTDTYADDTSRPAINYRGQVLYQTSVFSQLALYSPGAGVVIIQNFPNNRHDLQLTDSGLVLWSGGETTAPALFLGTPPGLNQAPVNYLLLGD